MEIYGFVAFTLSSDAEEATFNVGSKSKDFLVVYWLFSSSFLVWPLDTKINSAEKEKNVKYK